MTTETHIGWQKPPLQSICVQSWAAFMYLARNFCKACGKITQKYELGAVSVTLLDQIT